MKNHTSFQIGGTCDFLCSPQSDAQIQNLINYCSSQNIPLTIVGNGSNLLVDDNGIRGVVLLLTKDFAKITRTSPTTIHAQAGASITQICRFAAQQALSGIEFAFGIPATLGGAVYMNAGAYGGEMQNVVRSVTCIDPSGNPLTLYADQLDWAYRSSIFTGKNFCITGAELALTPAEPAAITARMTELLSRRKEKQPLAFPSAGSVFKRPQGAYAAALIEECGLKGFTVGGAQVSQKHSGFIINVGDATCKDVLAVIAHVQDIVQTQTGFALECEVKHLG